MIRKIKCSNCKKDFQLKSNAPSRHELENDLGRYFNAKCTICHVDQEYHVNEVVAEERKFGLIAYLIAGLLTAGLLAFAILSFGLIGIVIIVIPVLIYVRLKAGNEKAVTLFNQSDISRTRPKTR